MTIVTVEELGQEIVDLPALKMHLRVENDLEDTYLLNLVDSAIGFAEDFTRRCIRKRTVRFELDTFPISVLDLPLAPVISIQRIVYQTNGIAQTVAPYRYKTMLTEDTALLLPQPVWPFGSEVGVEAIVGYAAPPASLRQAVLLLCGHYYENREVMRDRFVNSNEMPFSVTSLLYPYRRWGWGV